MCSKDENEGCALCDYVISEPGAYFWEARLVNLGNHDPLIGVAAAAHDASKDLCSAGADAWGIIIDNSRAIIIVINSRQPILTAYS